MLPKPTADPAAAMMKPNREPNSPRCDATAAAPCLFVILQNCTVTLSNGVAYALRRDMIARSRPPRVVKLVDTGDLKSPAHCERAGSSPAPGTI